MSEKEGEIKKRVIQEVRIDVDDIKQTITKDRVLQIEIPEDKYLVSLKDLWKILDEAKKDFLSTKDLDMWKTYHWFEKWFGETEK
jgi:hypothetical protein